MAEKYTVEDGYCAYCPACYRVPVGTGVCPWCAVPLWLAWDAAGVEVVFREEE